MFCSKRFYELFCKHVKTYLEEMITNISPPLSTFCQVTVPLSWGLHTIVFFCLVLKSPFSISVLQYSWKSKKLVCKIYICLVFTFNFDLLPCKYIDIYNIRESIPLRFIFRMYIHPMMTHLIVIFGHLTRYLCESTRGEPFSVTTLRAPFV